MAKFDRSTLVIAGLAVGALVMARRSGKKGEVKGIQDTTGTLPPLGDDESPPPAEDPDQRAAEESAVALALSNEPTAYFLGQPGIDANVLGIDEEGYVIPEAGEWKSGWLSRVAFWAAYPYEAGYEVLQLPPSCLLASTCPPEMQPFRDSALRMMAMVRDGMKERGMKDTRYNPNTQKFGGGR